MGGGEPASRGRLTRAPDSRPLDMFPHKPPAETVALLEREPTA